MASGLSLLYTRSGLPPHRQGSRGLELESGAGIHHQRGMESKLKSTGVKEENVGGVYVYYLDLAGLCNFSRS